MNIAFEFGPIYFEINGDWCVSWMLWWNRMEAKYLPRKPKAKGE